MDLEDLSTWAPIDFFPVASHPQPQSNASVDDNENVESDDGEFALPGTPPRTKPSIISSPFPDASDKTASTESEATIPVSLEIFSKIGAGSSDKKTAAAGWYSIVVLRRMILFCTLFLALFFLPDI